MLRDRDEDYVLEEKRVHLLEKYEKQREARARRAGGWTVSQAQRELRRELAKMKLGYRVAPRPKSEGRASGRLDGPKRYFDDVLWIEDKAARDHVSC
jgi:hypothetical protein